MTTHVPYVIKNSGAVTMYINGESVTAATDHPNYNLILDSLKTGRFDRLDSLVNIAKAVKSYVTKSSDRVKIQDGVISVDGYELHNTLTVRILKMMSEGYQFSHMLRFLENLMQNPSRRAVNELYTFLENHGLPITEDGCFLAYKAVRNDYFDIWTGRTHKNLVGSTQSMPRNMVDEDWGRDCSQGLHCGALDYVVGYGHFVKGQIVPNAGNRLIIVKVNPKDVVSVPNYEKFTKMRVCSYVVVDEIKDVVKELDKVLYKAEGTESVKPVTPDRVVDEPKAEKETSAAKAVADLVRTMLSDGDDPAEYRDGYDVGSLDREDGEDYGFGRDYNAGEAYRKGYNDGYNDRPNQVDTYPEEETEIDECNGECHCRGCHESDEPTPEEEQDAEYSAGYAVGQDDAEAGNGFQTSLHIDDSDSFKAGYRDGYNDAAPF